MRGKLKIIKSLIIVIVLLITGCSKPDPVEIKNVCSQPENAQVVIHGYIYLPQMIDTIQLSRGGQITAVGYQLFMTTRADAGGEEVKATFWASDKGEPNKIKPLPRAYDLDDLIVYTDDGKEIPAGKIVKITGEVKPNEKSKCEINVTKIELP